MKQYANTKYIKHTNAFILRLNHFVSPFAQQFFRGRDFEFTSLSLSSSDEGLLIHGTFVIDNYVVQGYACYLVIDENREGCINFQHHQMPIPSSIADVEFTITDAELAALLDCISRSKTKEITGRVLQTQLGKSLASIGSKSKSKSKKRKYL